MRENVMKAILDNKVIAIVRGIESQKAVKVAEALYAGGVKLVEVTFNQKAPDSFSDTVTAIKSIKEAMGGKMTVGAGTVITLEQLELAKNAGAAYIVSPDTDAKIIEKTVEMDMVSLPGAYTASEAKLAKNAGADFVKLFPCVEGADKYLKALKGPLSHIKFLAVGGINADNANSFMKAGAVGVGVGGCLVNQKWVENDEYYKITEQAKKIVAAVNFEEE